ncbi:MAG: LytR C-terminal domain-containing protein [Candidatus Woesebacteria bacterium]|jgi:hypothetical protein
MADKETQGTKQEDKEAGSVQSTKETIRRNPSRKKGSKRWILVVVVLLILAAAGGWYFFLRPDNSQEVEEEEVVAIETSTPAPTEEPIEREGVSISVLNGTGIAEEAAYLQGRLRGLGYTDIDVGNAGSQEYESAQVTFSDDVDDSIVEEITDELEDTYQDVDFETDDSLTNVDIQIITGLRPGQTFPTPQPTATPLPEETATPTASPSATPTP